MSEVTDMASAGNFDVISDKCNIALPLETGFTNNNYALKHVTKFYAVTINS
jgi:hypothetical protein